MNRCAEDTILPFTKMRKRIAERLTYSKQHIPHFYLALDVDMSAALALRASFNAKNNIRVTVTDILLKATAYALSEFKKMNVHVMADKLVLKKSINIGIAVSIEDGILVPVIPDADKKSIEAIANVSRKKAEDARRSVFDPRIAGTFTISNFGMFGIGGFSAIINPPECAILAVGAVQKRVVPVNDSLCIRDMMTINLACDHRAVDGTYAAGFLNYIKHHL